MIIRFNLPYNTVFGEELKLNVVDDKGTTTRVYGMNINDDRT